jgi:lysophospholipase L1-like esterase
MIAGTALLFGMITLRSISSKMKHTTHLKLASSYTNTQPKTIRILAYGDSLTAGTSPPMDQLFPYGPSLENELNELYADSDVSVVVRWRGLPGWTASTMVEHLDDSFVGLRSAVSGIKDPALSLVIILAGTNDIGMLTSSMTKDASVEEAVEPILGLHKACLELDQNDSSNDVQLQTLAVGIPGSAWQQMNPSAKKLCDDMNASLKEFAASSFDGRVTYVDFPFEYSQGDSKWSGDGLHFSPEGYEVLGVELAKSVKKILDDL